MKLLGGSVANAFGGGLGHTAKVKSNPKVTLGDATDGYTASAVNVYGGGSAAEGHAGFFRGAHFGEQFGEGRIGRKDFAGTAHGGLRAGKIRVGAEPFPGVRGKDAHQLLRDPVGDQTLADIEALEFARERGGVGEHGHE